MAKASRTPHYQVTTAILRERGIDFQIEHGGKHPRLAFCVVGERVRFTLPSSPSDWRGQYNSAANIKRAILNAEQRAARRGAGAR